MLVVATRGAVGLAGEDVTDLAGAAVWGLVRSAQTEHPGRVVLVDSDGSLDDAAVAAALAVGEPQVLVRGGPVYGARVQRSRAVDGMLVPPGDGAWRLGIGSAGTFEDLQLEPVPNAGAPLAAGQVRVALARRRRELPRHDGRAGHVPHGALLGGEGAGVVVEVGPGVTEFAVGDSVYRILPGWQRHAGRRRRPAGDPDARRTGRTPRPRRISAVFTTA